MFFILKFDIHYLLPLSGKGPSGHCAKLLFLCATPNILLDWTPQGWVNIHFGGALSLKMSQTPFFWVTADELKHWSRMISDGCPLFKLSAASACLNKTTVWSDMRARGLSSRQWMGTNLCTCVGSLLFVTESVGGVPSDAPTFILKHITRLIQVCTVIAQAASFKANRWVCS